ncbi:MAG: IS200/IS605 family transposase [Candidatus Margulisiibacteriota bacterium]
MGKYVHYVFSTYKRRQLISEDVAECLKTAFADICRGKGFRIECYDILIDHVHLLIEKQDNDSNEYVMKMVKGLSSKAVLAKFSTNRFDNRKLWGRGYRAYEIIDSDSLRKVIDYIKGQKANGEDKRFLQLGNRDDIVAGFQA